MTVWNGGRAIASTGTGRAPEVLTYASPVEMLFSPDGARLYVLCQGSDEVRVLDGRTYASIKRHSGRPHPARLLALTRMASDSSSPTPGTTRFRSIDTDALSVAATWPVAAEPSSVVEDREGKHLFVANRVSNDVAVLNAQTGEEEKRLAAGRGASYITPSPDGTQALRHACLSEPAAPAHAGRQSCSARSRKSR